MEEGEGTWGGEGTGRRGGRGGGRGKGGEEGEGGEEGGERGPRVRGGLSIACGEPGPELGPGLVGLLWLRGAGPILHPSYMKANRMRRGTDQAWASGQFPGFRPERPPGGRGCAALRWVRLGRGGLGAGKADCLAVRTSDRSARGLRADAEESRPGLGEVQAGNPVPIGQLCLTGAGASRVSAGGKRAARPEPGAAPCCGGGRVDAAFCWGPASSRLRPGFVHCWLWGPSQLHPKPRPGPAQVPN